MTLLAPEASALDTPPPVRPHLRRAVAADRDDLIRFVEGLSPSSSHHRFLIGMGGRVPRTLVEQLLSGGRGGGALVALVADRLVAHALWARSEGPNEPVAEIALVVADAYQRHGIGSMLIDAMRVEMMRDGIERVRVVTGAGNRPVLGMIARRQPAVKPVERDGAVL
ncbi:MAG: GNAT family N-acetyltransferase, partial [Actinomycetota bacterium]|nr:GNAT family N-acetyltransferase [Actinomycetota bacterium]